MLEYIVNFNQNNAVEFIDELDISDKSILQEQINKCRKNHFELIKMYDSLQHKLIKNSEQIMKKKRESMTEFDSRTERSNFLSTDPEYLSLLIESDSLKFAMSTVTSQIDYVKSDIRILTNSMYSKN